MLAEEAAPQERLAQVIKELEVEDDDDDALFSPVTPPEPRGAPAAGAAAEEEEPAVRVAWDSSDSRRKRYGQSTDPPSDSTAQSGEAAALKDRGNEAFRTGDVAAALSLYQQALAACSGQESDSKDLEATLHSNVAAAEMRRGRPAAAAAAARRAAALRPASPKPLRRLAEALLACGEFAAAAAAARRGEQLCPPNADGHTQFTPLLDRIATEAAARGSDVGFTGRRLEVRSAGEEAWLGRPAPHVPALDGPLDEDTALPSDDLSTISAAAPNPPAAAAGLLPSAGAAAPDLQQKVSARADALADWHFSDAVAPARRQRTSFRCLSEAVAAAADGDRILLRRGVHNGMGRAVDITKRLLIEGDGFLGETVIDQRANVPTLRISRGGVVVRNLDFDHTGFREALLIDGAAPKVAPLVDGCAIRCSGDDAVNVGGRAAPTLRGCSITGKKCGLRAFDSAAVTLESCVIEKCGEQGVRAAGGGRVDATLCVLRDCGEEGALAMDAAALNLRSCTVTGNKGPGVDLSGDARAAVSGGEVAANVGGVWLWDRAAAELEGVRLEGGSAPVILADENGAPAATACVIKGTVHAPDAAWRGLLGPGRSNQLEDPDAPTDFPPEAGPFRFVPSPYTRI